ncbi:MAG: hypothetical protein AMXMBFR13_29190 [Phycisphaerae bacterium]
MADEQTTLLKFQGDASGARTAAQEAAAAIRQVESSLEGLNARGREAYDFYKAFGFSDAEALSGAQQASAAQAQARTIDILTGSADKAAGAFDRMAASKERALSIREQELIGTFKAFGDSDEEARAAAARVVTQEILTGESAANRAADAHKKFGDSQQRAGRQSVAFREVLMRLSPELGMLAELAQKGGDALGFMFTPMGAGAAAAIAGLSAFVGFLRSATAESERFTVAQQKLAEAMAKVTEMGARAMAEQGVASEEAAAQARPAILRLQERGLGDEAIQAVIGQAFDKTGQQVLTEEEIETLAIQEEFQPGVLKDQGLQGARAKAERERDKIEQQRKYLDQRRARENQRIQQLDVAAIRERLGKGAGAVPADQLDAAVEDVLGVVRQGDVGTSPGSVGEFFSMPFDFQARQRSAVDRALKLGLIDRQRADELTDRGFWGATGQSMSRALDFGIPEELRGSGVGRWTQRSMEAPAPPGGDAAPGMKPPESPAGKQVSWSSYGPVYVGARRGGPQPRFQGFA